MANQVSRWQPTGSTLTLRDAMDRLFEDSVVWPRWFFNPDTLTGVLSNMPLDMYETPDEVVVNMTLPGVKSEDVNIQFNDGRLVVDANIPAPKLENVTWHYREVMYGQYHRELTLPVRINTDKVEATLHDGFLMLHLPKADEIKPKKIQIKAVGK
ncbi:MAG: Hsp20/alpha crystallin family protein [Anaerolineae bacterium]